MAERGTSDSWVVFEFTDRWLDDYQRGGLRALDDYLALYPGHESAIRREHAELVRSHEPSTHAGGHVGTGAGVTRQVGPYRLLAELGRGGQARVWLAEDTVLRRKVALKVLGASLVGASPERRERFRREAALVARLEHPGLCGVLGTDLEAEQPWIAMRFVEGQTLSALLAREREELELARAARAPHPIQGARLAEKLLLFERAARALHAAHEAGVVHRDVKPGNIMVAKDGAPVVLDFGLAHAESGEETITKTGEVFGTPAYMAPEQLDGRPADRRTDVYALGVVLYEAVTLQRPHGGASSESLARAIRTELPRDPLALNPRLPRDLAVVLFTALEKEPDRRYPTALDLAEELRRVREYEPILARRVGVLGRLARWARRQPLVAGATVGSIALLSLALTAALLFIRELREERNAKQAALERYEGAWFRDLSAGRLEVMPTDALHYAIEAADREPGLATNRALLAALDVLHERASLAGHSGTLTQIDVAPDGRVATSSLDGTVRIWDAGTARTLATLAGHGGKVWSVRFDPRGERVVTASEDGTARVWDLSRPAAEPIVLRGHNGEVTWAEFDSTGARVVTASRDRTARIHSAADGSEQAVLRGHTGTLRCAAFFAGDRYVLTASGDPPAPAAAPESDGTVRLFDAASGESLAVLAEHVAPVRGFAFHPDGRRFVTISDDASIRMWDVERLARGETASLYALKFPGRASAASFHPGGKRLAVAFEAGGRVVAVEDGATLYELPDHDHRSIIDIAYDARGERLATAAFDNTVRVFDGASGAQLAICRGVHVRPRGVRWGPDGSWFLSWHTTSDAKVWYGRQRPFLPVLEPGAGGLWTARFDPTGRTILVAGTDGSASELDAQSGVLRRRIDPRPGEGGPSALVFADYDEGGTRIVARSADGTIAVLDAASGRPLQRLRSSPAPDAPAAPVLLPRERIAYVDVEGRPALASLADGRVETLRGLRGRAVALRASADGTLLACGTDQRTVHLWRLDRASAGDCAWTNGPYEEANFALNSVYEVAFSPDGRFLAATGQHQRTWLVDVASGEKLSELVLATVGQLEFSRDGRYLFTTGRWTGFARAFRTAGPDGRPALVDRDIADVRAWQKTGSYRSLARSPVANLVLAGSLDRTAKLWDLDAGECVATYPGHRDAVYDVDFAPDGQRFVTASGDGTARIWPVDLLAAARAAWPAGAPPPPELARPVPRTR